MHSPMPKSSTIFTVALATSLSVFLPAAVSSGEMKSAGLVAADTQWETPYYIIDSGLDGPTVVLTGGIHGDQPAGFRAAEQIRQWPITKGCLVVIPRVNKLGLEAKSRHVPNVVKAHRDLDRNFVTDDDGGLSTEGTLASELWSLVSKQNPDWVIDLHEGSQFHVSHRPTKGKKRSHGSSIICEAKGDVAALVDRALTAANSLVVDPSRQFAALDRGPIAGSFARAASEQLGATSVILETTYQDQPISLRTRQHRAMVNSLLNDIGLINSDCSSRISRGTTAEAIQVAYFDGPGARSANIPRIVDESAKIDLYHIGPSDVRPAVTSQFDLLIFPGGSGSKQGKALGEERRNHVRTFVRDGGGYVGVCAGAYLSSAHYSWSLDLIDSSVFAGSREIEGVGRKQMWYRGTKSRVDLELSEAGKRLFTGVPPKFDVLYHNGPIISPKEIPEIEDYTPLAWFRSEQVRYEPQRGTMVDTPAIVSGRFGRGRIVSISPHPEADQALESIIVDSIRWAVDQQPQ